METESLLERSLVEQWRELVARKTRVWNALELELDRRHGLSASEFEVLDTLSEYDCATPPRVQELADHVPITQSALSRMIGRLESQHLVTRTLCADDRRGVFVVLTEQGLAKLAEARPTHRAVLAAEFGTSATPDTDTESGAPSGTASETPSDASRAESALAART
ncbi:MarR family winged helix-turn-helix transcriptional regulator [Catenulispora subtropica]|uniref:HTH marR-type domain-containing protein n=1 Tax=Catenulispora subtropica TaxID=450798 RepID=A0ABN2S7P6_9ACTN